jgi:hypothetical protein
MQCWKPLTVGHGEKILVCIKSIRYIICQVRNFSGYPVVHAFALRMLYITLYRFVCFKFLTAVVMKSTVLWAIMPCSPLKVN